MGRYWSRRRRPFDGAGCIRAQPRPSPRARRFMVRLRCDALSFCGTARRESKDDDVSLTVKVNELTLVHQGSDGKAICSAPDACKTPPQNLPIPYVNVAFSRDL